MVRFEIGKTYACRSICDWDCIFEFEVVARSAKRLIIKDDLRGERKVGVKIFNDEEYCKPLGSYSMAPVLRAGDRATN